MSVYSDQQFCGGLDRAEVKAHADSFAPSFVYVAVALASSRVCFSGTPAEVLTLLDRMSAAVLALAPREPAAVAVENLHDLATRAFAGEVPQ